VVPQLNERTTFNYLKLLIMKTFSAFYLCGAVLLLFVGLSIAGFALDLGEATGFFICSSVVFAMMLPSCSKD
jgi:hypothetical protein